MTAVRPSAADDPTINPGWRTPNVQKLRHEVVEVQNLLREIENCVEMATFHGDTQWAGELRKVAGLTRERRDAREQRARELETTDR